MQIPRGYRKKSLLCRKCAIMSIRWKFQFSEGWGGSLKKVLILVQRHQHKSTPDPVAAPKNIKFRIIFIEVGDTKKYCTFSGHNLAPKRRKKLLGALRCMHKSPKCIQSLWDHPKKFLLCKSTKKARYVRSLGKNHILGHSQRLKKLTGALSCMHKGPKCIQSPWDHPKKIPFVQKHTESAICAILREKPHFGAFPETKKGVVKCAILRRGPIIMEIPQGYRKKKVTV